MTSPPPYAADTRAKGWRFELDMERFEGSDTWLRAKTAPTRALLMFLWAKAWTQKPVGTLPADDELIALMLDMDLEEFGRAKAILLRGWWLAEDGRLYHDVLVERVIEMMGRRRSDSDRQALKRARDKGRTPPLPPASPQNPAKSPDVTRDIAVTDAVLTRESDTEYRIPNTDMVERATPGRAPVAHPVPEIADPEGFDPTPGGRIVQALRRRAKFLTGLPGDARLLALLEQGATEDEFVGVGTEATSRGKSWAWLLTVVENRRSDAARIVLKPPPGITTASDAAERTLQLIRGQQLSPEEYAASLEAKRRVLGKSRKKSA